MISDKDMIAEAIIDPDYTVVDSIISCENDEGFIFNVKHPGLQKDQVVYAIRPSLIPEVIRRLAIKQYKSCTCYRHILREAIAMKISGDERSNTVFDIITKIVDNLGPDEIEDFFTNALQWDNFMMLVMKKYGFLDYKDAIGAESVFSIIYKQHDYYIIKCKKTDWEGF